MKTRLPVFGFPFDKNYMKAHGWIDAPRRIPVRDEKISWARAYERRMRRFNLEVIVLALSALTILTAWLFIAEWALFRIAALSRHLGLIGYLSLLDACFGGYVPLKGMRQPVGMLGEFLSKKDRN